MASARSFRTASVIAAVFLGLLAVIALFILAMTQPRFATPVVRAAIGMAAGAETQLDSARFSLRWPPGFELRGLRITGDGPAHMSVIDGRLNPLGFLPRVAFLPEVRAEDGELTATVGVDGAGGPPGWLREIGRLEARAIRIGLARPDEEPDIFIVDTASGEVRNGALNLVGRGGNATVFFDGGLTGPLLNAIDGDITIRGENLAEFADLLGLAAPDTPPYEWHARLSSGPDLWRLNGLSGTVGDSDLAGDIEVRLSGERPFITASLTSRTLDFDDLGLFIGAPTQVEGETANDLQRATNEAYAQSDRLIPNATLDLSRVRSVDADLRFQAESVRAGGFPMEAVEIAMTLEDGVMRFDPLAFSIAQGGMRAAVEIDARDDAVRTEASGEIDGVMLDRMGGGNLIRGELEGHFAFTTTGGNLQTAAAGMDGSMAFWVLNGQLRALVEEAADLDVLGVLLIMLTEDVENPNMRDLRCGVARFEIENGVARADPVVFDSDNNVIAMEGTLDFSTEVLGFDIDADNKTLSWGQLFGDVTLGGTLRDPQVSPQLEETLLQGGIAALLSTLASPLAALPFFNIPSGEDQPCGALMARAQAAASAMPEAEAATE